MLFKTAPIPKKILVVTPYYKEDRSMLEYCIASVANQTVSVDHMLVADGFAQSWLDQATVRHVKLDKAHADYGDVARGIGALMGIAENYDAIAFLDADNWYDPDHIETCITACRNAPAANFIVARRRFVRPDKSIMESVTPDDIPLGSHIDTNCYFFLRASFHLLHYWSQIPQQMASHGDALFKFILQYNLPGPLICADKITVNYLCMFRGTYLQAGEIPPHGSKEYVNWNDCKAWLNTLDVYEYNYVQRLIGLSIQRA